MKYEKILISNERRSETECIVSMNIKIQETYNTSIIDVDIACNERDKGVFFGRNHGTVYNHRLYGQCYNESYDKM